MEKSKNLWDVQNKSRKIESLALICQDSAEKGDMAAAVYADAFEVIREMATDIRRSADDAEKAVTA